MACRSCSLGCRCSTSSYRLFLVSAFAALVVDRDQMRGRLLGLIEAGVDFSSTAVPRLGPRPMRLLAGVMLGLSFGIKWSAAPFMVGFLLLSFWWDRGAFKAAGVRRHWTVSITRSWITGLGSLVVVPIFAYLLTWAGWFAGENSFNRRWGETHSGIGYDRWYLPGFIVDHFPAAIRSLINYHLGAMSFHEGLTSPHPYESQPWSWLILGRPVSYYYPSNPTGCGSDKCTRAILMIGTPAIWWAFVPVLLWLLWVLFTRRDWRAGAIWIAFLAGWGFWLNYPTRTKFLFYMAPLVPFLIMGVAMALGAMLKWDQVRTDRAEDRLALFEAELAERDLRDAELEARAEEENADSTTESRPDAAVAVDLEPVELPALPIRWGMLITAGYLGLVVANFVWMWPIFTGNLLTYQGWLSRMWFDAWI